MRRFGRKAIVEAIRGQAAAGAASITVTLSAADALALADDIEIAGMMCDRSNFEARVMGAVEGGEA